MLLLIYYFITFKGICFLSSFSKFLSRMVGNLYNMWRNDNWNRRNIYILMYESNHLYMKFINFESNESFMFLFPFFIISFDVTFKVLCFNVFPSSSYSHCLNNLHNIWEQYSIQYSIRTIRIRIIKNKLQ